MSRVSTTARVVRRQARNVARVLSGRRLTTTPLGSMTLDRDDVELANTWLRDRKHWGSQAVVSRYEDEFACWNGSEHAFAFMGGRVALSACIHALRLRPGDEVILPGYTCVVVPNAFDYAGVRTVYSDIELDTYGLDVSRISERITHKTRAILLQHLYGLVCRDYEAILDLAKRHELKVIEDCAHSTGAAYKGTKVGNQGDVAFYSTEQSKVFNTIQGGIATTNDITLAKGIREYYERADLPDETRIDKQLRNVALNYYRSKHPQRWWKGALAEVRYPDRRLVSTTSEEEQGIRPAHYGRRMPAPIAALGLNQLKKLDHYNELRRRTARRWDAWCKESGYEKPLVVEESSPIYLRYPVLVEPEKKRDRSWATEELDVEAGVWFVSNVHPVRRTVKGCPQADEAVERCVNLPTLL